VVTAGADETARIWHVATGKVTSTLVHDAGVLDVLYSPDGTQILTRTTETSGHSWSSATGKELPFAHQGPVTAMAFASDGRHVALATAGNDVRLWDQASQTVVETWSGHTAAITSLDLSSDGQYLATASEDGTARLWSIGSHGELASLVHDGPVLDVAFWADTSRLATASGDGVARIWARDLMPWLAWGCALAESRSDAVTTWDACATSSRDRVRVAGVLTEPPIIYGDPPRRELIVEHGVEFLLIPGGTFKMGSPPGEGENHEHPQHEVRIDDFYLARTELTNAQYLLFLSDNPQIAEPKLWHEDAYNQPDQPVVGLTWYEATAYCEWAGFVLPTEAQWEYAARANTETVYWFGDDANEFDRFGWHLDNAGGRAHSVATIGANAFGLYDMTGNVFEWVLDSYETYEVVPRPGDGLRRAPAGEGVIRGGAWYHSPRFHRSAEREMTSFDRSGYNQLGFRPAIQPAIRPPTDQFGRWRSR
jgi:formylglycine-generating enzyme required for sulfatase activity